MNMKIKKGDLVEVITGKVEDKGKRGEVIRILSGERRLVIQGINVRTKHQKQMQSQGRTINPGKVKFEAPIAVSNVMLVCKKCNKPTRVSIQRTGEKVSRVCKKCQALLDE
jgi:large subunit ribosomal protein L24